MKCNAEQPFSALHVSDVVKGAMISSNGQLTPKYEYIADMRKQKGY